MKLTKAIILIMSALFVLLGAGAFYVMHRESIPQGPVYQEGIATEETAESSAHPTSSTSHTVSDVPSMQVMSVHSEGPATISVSYSHLPDRVRALAVCMAEGNACTDWVEPFIPASPTGVYTMSAQGGFGEGSQKGLGQGTYKIVVMGSDGDKIVASDSFVVKETLPEKLQSYVNTRYGFSIHYPVAMQVQTTGYSSTQFFDTPPEAYITLRNDAEQTEGYLTFNVGTVAKNAENCPNPGDAPGIYLKRIGDQSFAQREILGPGGGIQRSYTIRSGDTCYAMVATAFPSACINSGCSNPKWSAQTETSLLNQFKDVIQSFRFSE